MSKILSILLSFFLIGCFTINNNFSSADEFVGTWHAGNNHNAVLRIHPRGSGAYDLRFESKNFRWEGLGYRDGEHMIAIFRYKNVDERGYVTFTPVKIGEMNFVSRNADGSLRSSGYYVR